MTERLTSEAERIRLAFPERLQEAIYQKGWTPAQLAYESGVPECTIRSYLSGRGAPRAAHLSLCARALDESIDWLLDSFALEHKTPDLEEPSEEEALVLAAVAALNDTEVKPTFTSVAAFVNSTKQRVGIVLRRLEAAGWAQIQQSGRRSPGGISVTSKYTEWYTARP